MTDRELDEVIGRLLIDSEDPAIYADAGPQPAFSPSRRHEREMRKMLQNPLAWARRRARPRWKTVLEKAALVFLVLFVSMGALFAFSPAAQALVSQWFEQWDNGHILQYRYDGPALARLLPRYAVAALPEGYAETERIELFTATFVTYANEAGDTLYLEYGQVAEGAQVRRKKGTFRSDLMKAVPVCVRETDGQYYPAAEPGGDNTLLWYDREEGIQYALAGPWAQEDMVHMAESISLVKTTK